MTDTDRHDEPDLGTAPVPLVEQRAPASAAATPAASTAASTAASLASDPALRFRDPVAPIARRLGWRWAFVLAVAIYGLGEKILLPMYGGYLTLGGELSAWRPDVEALVSGFLFVPTLFAAYVWQVGGTRSVLVGFARADSFADAAAFAGFVDDVRRWFARQRWWLIAVAIAIAGVLVQGLWLWDPDNPKPVAPWWEQGEPLSRVVALALALPLWYVAAQIVIGEVRLTWTLRQLWRRLGASFVLRGRQDGGGVTPLSRHIAILVTIGAVVLLNLILGMLLPQIRDTTSSPDFIAWLVLIWAAYLIVVPGITLALIWPAHTVMSRRKDERLNAVTAEINKELALVESKISDAPALIASIERLDGLRRLKSLLQAELPRWPLQYPLRTVSWSAIVPFSLSVLTSVLDQVA